MSNGEESTPEEKGDVWEDRDPSEYHIETFRHAIEDARRTHAYQIEAYDDIDEKSWRILQFNGVIATIAVAGVVNIAPPFPAYVWVPALGGFGSLVYSTYLAIDGQPEKRITVGPSINDFQNINNMNPAESVYLSWMMKLYAEYAEEGVEKVETNAETVDRAKLFSIMGVGVLLVSGLLYAATGSLI